MDQQSELTGQRADGLPPVMRPASLGDTIYDAILARIISLRIAPGSRINIDTMARELGVSQTPVRAALIRLESEGLVVKEHHVGFSAVPLPDTNRLREIAELRTLLEPFAAGRAAEALTDDDARELTDIARRIEEPASTDPKVVYSQTALLDAALHNRIMRIGGCHLIAEIFGRLYAHTHLFRLMHRLNVREAAIAEHRAILAALLDRDPVAARAAMEVHVLNNFARMAPLAEDRT